MKSLLTCLLAVVSLSVFAQKQLDLKVVDDFEFEILKPAKELPENIIEDSIPSIDLKANHWDHTVYNPFKEEVVTFPIQIRFKDSTYASPMKRHKVVTSRYGWRRGRDFRPHRYAR